VVKQKLNKKVVFITYVIIPAHFYHFAKIGFFPLKLNIHFEN